jgi:hypothetical protein
MTKKKDVTAGRPVEISEPFTLDAELLADFGHQVRNQLNAVVGAANLLSEIGK